MLCPFETECIDYFFQPTEVRAKIAVAKGKLQLCPITDMSKLVVKSSTSSFVATGPEVNWFIDAPMRPRSSLPRSSKPTKTLSRSTVPLMMGWNA